ncbi:MAG TPA: hypothetical protein PLZ08_10205 [Bacillota bacterium]|mgnify:CR=1 FL=1|nr:hypothetical protein [Bacillota bacterium]HOL10093.1 hypothetical protein [Bacillota bacterium]HPO98310.1 hypothetical protein [Bacillota bacterium]
MKLTKNFQIWLVVISFILTTGVLFGGQALATKLQVKNPLDQEMAKLNAVEKYTVEAEGDGLRVNLSLKQTKDLNLVMQQVQKNIETFHKKPVRSFNIVARSNPKLEEIRYQLSFYLEEALASGQYIQLMNALESYQPSITAKVFLNADFVYLQLEDGNNYLYQAIPRNKVNIRLNQYRGGDVS